MAGLPPRLELARDLVLGCTNGCVLELGGGSGVLAAALMDHVERYVGVDRSEHAVAATSARLGRLDTTTRWSVERGTLTTVDLPALLADVVVAVNVNLFWTTSAAAELERVRELLTPTGCLVLVYETPADPDERLLDPLTRSLTAASFAFSASPVRARLAVMAAPERARG